jgi:crotonobetaine/carnitine-CoA ligase
MAHCMVPRYVRVVDELPKTPSQKVQKHLLRTEGVKPTPGTAPPRASR